MQCALAGCVCSRSHYYEQRCEQRRCCWPRSHRLCERPRPETLNERPRPCETAGVSLHTVGSLAAHIPGVAESQSASVSFVRERKAQIAEARLLWRIAGRGCHCELPMCQRDYVSALVSFVGERCHCELTICQRRLCCTMSVCCAARWRLQQRVAPCTPMLCECSLRFVACTPLLCGSVLRTVACCAVSHEPFGWCAVSHEPAQSVTALWETPPAQSLLVLLP